MAFDNFRMIRAVTQLIQGITTSEAVMRSSAASYRKNRVSYDAAVLAGDPQARLDRLNAEALHALRNGTQYVSKMQSAVRRFLAKATTKYGSQAAALVSIDAAIATIANSGATRQELMAELTALRVHEDAIVDGVTNQSWTLDQVADYIELNLSDEDDFYRQPMEDTYTQAWE